MSLNHKIENILNIKCALIFIYKFYSKQLLPVTDIYQFTVKMNMGIHGGVHVKCLLLFSFSQKFECIDRF
jgi:hypothetical protein